MSVFKTDCPYCSTKNVAFTILHDTLWSKDAHGTGSGSCLWDALSKCGYCERGIVATFLTQDQTPPKNDHSIQTYVNCATIARHQCAEIHPPKCRTVLRASYE